ncbi:integrator complex subunit 1-like isoform X2 [Anneissia japonica]|uniref:integrator complex subunit 1-like isoform X2 n=1 Tax=Anneissia japonica TaxID=1529436 RepID=UPI0014254CB1|nr:integrator complex subunit 1-like isoform X2 [Anneissia japonica]
MEWKGGRKPSRGRVHHPKDVIALGSKGSDVKTSSAARPSIHDRKREAGSSLQQFEPKRKLLSSTLTPLGTKMLSPTLTPLGRGFEIGKNASPSSSTTTHGDSIAIEVLPRELVDKVLEADSNEEEDHVDALLCGAIKNMKQNRAKPDSTLYLALMYLAKSKPYLFLSKVVMESICSLLKRDIGLSFKSKGNPLVSVLACNLLMTAFSEEDNWPEDFVKVYIEDSLGERVWVDQPKCKEFITNVLTAFGTRLPPQSIDPFSSRLVSGSPDISSASASPSHDDGDAVSDAGDSIAADVTESLTSQESINFTSPRYSLIANSIDKYIVDLLKEQLARRQAMDIPRNLLRLLTVTAGLTEVRLLVVQRLEMWLQNPKITRLAQEVLMSICMNCSGKNPSDRDLISHLIKIRMKTKQLVSHYMACIKELVDFDPENLSIVIKHVIYNELSSARNPNNMVVLSTLFSHSPEASANCLANVFQELLMNRDDYLRAVRALFREIVRSLRYEIDMPAFCRGLMKERLDSTFIDLDQQIKERMLQSTTDLLSLSIMVLAVSPTVKEAKDSRNNPDSKDILRNVRKVVSKIHRDAVWWLHTVVPKMYQNIQTTFLPCLRKVLLMDALESYCKVDNWPQEIERSVMAYLFFQGIPVEEDTLIRLLLMGLNQLPVPAQEAFDIIDFIVKRAVAGVIKTFDYNCIHVEKKQLIDFVLDLSAYHHPDNIALPQGFQPPSLAISKLYWKGWLLLVIIAAFNPSSIGRIGWDNYPMLKCFMEMVMTNNYTYPPPTNASDERSAEDAHNRELQMCNMEKHDILEFETHLAAASTKTQITEATSLFLPLLMSMDKHGAARKPPASVLEELRKLNHRVQLGIRLCRSRNPDFLLEIIQRQGTSQSMPWLADLVNSSESSLDVLPVQCLCEFLLHDSVNASEDRQFEVETEEEQNQKRQKINKHEQLLRRLQFLISGTQSEAQATCEVLDYFLRRLSSQHRSARIQASKALSDVLSNEDQYSATVSDEADTYCSKLIETHAWLLQAMPSLLHFDSVQEQACHALTQACQVETDPQAIAAYLVFLSSQAPIHQLHNMASLALDLAQLIVERPTIMHCVLCRDKETNEVADQSLAAMIAIFSRYLRKATLQKEEAYSWSDTQDQVFVRWPGGQAATVNILVVHAMVILLTYGQPKCKSEFLFLLDAWFPEDSAPPSAFLVDTSEEALLLPDWLKLRMIRSTVPRLVDAALHDLEPAQLILFIQSFGIPVASMGKLMSHLDNAVHNDFASMEQAVVDKSYMAQLVEVQHMRGASGGHDFLRLLGCGQQEPAKDDVVMESVEPEVIVQKVRLKQVQHRDTSEWKLVLTQVFKADDKNRTALKLLRDIQRISYNSGTQAEAGRKCMASLLQAVHQLVTEDQEFLNNFINRHSISSCFLNLLITYQNSCKTGSNQLLNELLERLGQRLSSSQTTPLSNVIKHAKAKLARSTAFTIENVSFSKLQLDEILQDCFGQAAQSTSIKVRSKQIVDVLSEDARLKTAIQQSKDELSTDGELLESTAGLLVDWFELLQPEIVDAASEFQQWLLFSRKIKSDSSGKKQYSGSAYLLAVLTHQANWEHLNHCISWLLTLDDQQLNKIQASAALDFIWACLHIPKIWQGRTFKAQESLSGENVLCLSARQVCTLARYIITEAEALSMVHDANSEENRHKNGHSSDIIQARLPLLLNCCQDNGRAMDELVAHLSSKMMLSNQSSLYQTLLLELYIQTPVESDLVAMVNLGDVLMSNNHAKVDALTHRLLLSLVDVHNQDKWKTKVSKANSACRKLASVHPILMLRQLGMISVLCQGRTNVSFHEFRNRGLTVFFMNILGLMELLEPQLFKQDVNAFHSILDAYFGVIKRYGVHKKAFEVMYRRFVVLLYEYNAFCPTAAQAILEKYATILNELSLVLPDLHQLKCILAGITLTHTSKDHADNTDNTFKAETAEEVFGLPSRDSTASPTLLVCKDQIWGPSLIAKFTDRLSSHQDFEDVTDALHDLDEQSSRIPQVLDNFAADLMRLMCAPSVECRIMAFSLIIKLLRQNPSTSIKFLPAFLQCLDSSDNEVIETALKHLPEFCLLCQESARILLEKAFRVGVEKKLDATAIISDTMQLLNMEMLSS